MHALLTLERVLSQKGANATMRSSPMSLESNKTLGGIGAILLAIPFLNLIGIILVLIAMKGLAEYYNENDIFQNALYGFFFGIIGVIALIAVIIMFVIGVAVTAPVTAPLAGIVLLIIGIVVMYVFSLLGALFYRKSLNILSEKSTEKMFETAGLLLLIGAIIPIIGEILKAIAWILAAAGFFSIKTPTTQLPVAVSPSAPMPPPSPPVPVSVEKKYCRYCGTENSTDAVFCEKCGKKIAEE
jgi:uncharacterized membrane protein